MVLDLTPNYLGNKPWFGGSKSAEVMEKLKVRGMFFKIDLLIDLLVVLPYWEAE